jgi:aspartyl-tRNA(Asn)/glutamyl-tRNA(Gln) amidotransferase subunit C
MSALSNDDIKHVARLAKLDLTPSEIQKFVSQLSSVVDYISQLSEVETDGVEPTSQTTGLTNVKRLDEARPENGLSQEESLSGTGKTYNGYFIVPGILEERTDK